MTQDGTKTLEIGAPLHPDTGINFKRIETLSIWMSAIWFIATISLFLFSDHGATALASNIQFALIILTVFVPIGLLWTSVTALRAADTVRRESRNLQAAAAALQRSAPSQKHTAKTSGTVEKKLDEIAAAQRKTQHTLTAFTSIRQEAARQETQTIAPAQVETQPSLDLEAPLESSGPQLSVIDFIRAMNFPETAEDKEGFRALRLALSDRKIGLLIHAAQDILTLLSQDGIYMDDLHPDKAKPEVWRSFAKGERGRVLADLGGIRDRSHLSQTSARMKQDAIFRDAVHHFLRKFDRIFAEFEDMATDEEISALADSRTARAFMLLGRVAGTFD